jgi:hypothetical protein
MQQLAKLPLRLPKVITPCTLEEDDDDDDDDNDNENEDRLGTGSLLSLLGSTTNLTDFSPSGEFSDSRHGDSLHEDTVGEEETTEGVESIRSVGGASTAVTNAVAASSTASSIDDATNVTTESVCMETSL